MNDSYNLVIRAVVGPAGRPPALAGRFGPPPLDNASSPSVSVFSFRVLTKASHRPRLGRLLLDTTTILVRRNKSFVEEKKKAQIVHMYNTHVTQLVLSPPGSAPSRKHARRGSCRSTRTRTAHWHVHSVYLSGLSATEILRQRRCVGSPPSLAAAEPSAASRKPDIVGFPAKIYG